MTKDFLAAEILKIRVFEPALTERLVGERAHALQNEQARHEANRERRVSGTWAVDVAELPLDATPIDPLRQSDQRMVLVDDPVEGGPEELLLTVIARLRHRILDFPIGPPGAPTKCPHQVNLPNESTE